MERDAPTPARLDHVGIAYGHGAVTGPQPQQTLQHSRAVCRTGAPRIVAKVHQQDGLPLAGHRLFDAVVNPVNWAHRCQLFPPRPQLAGQLSRHPLCQFRISVRGGDDRHAGIRRVCVPVSAQDGDVDDTRRLFQLLPPQVEVVEQESQLFLRDLRPRALADVGTDDGDEDPSRHRRDLARQHPQHAAGRVEPTLVPVDVWIGVVGKGHHRRHLLVGHYGVKVIRGHHGNVAEGALDLAHQAPLGVGVRSLGHHGPVQREIHPIQGLSPPKLFHDQVAAVLVQLRVNEAAVGKSNADRRHQLDPRIPHALDEPADKTARMSVGQQPLPLLNTGAPQRVILLRRKRIGLMRQPRHTYSHNQLSSIFRPFDRELSEACVPPPLA
jgi:hypothetical protein